MQEHDDDDDDDDDENKYQNQTCDPPYPQAIVASNNHHDDTIGSPTATTTEKLVGTYTASYRENGKLCNSRTNMVFTSLRPTSGRGFAISGSGSDSDGTFDIIEGLMAPDGQAYWIEQQGKRQILSTGVFTTTATKTTSSMMTADDSGIIDEYAGTTVPVFFQGQWQSSNGVVASYDNYALDTTTNQHDIEHGAAAGGAPAAAYAFGYNALDAAAVGVAQQYRPTYY
jgi:hypothetical protein